MIAELLLVPGAEWVDNDLVISTRTGTPVSPGNYDQTLARLVDARGDLEIGVLSDTEIVEIGRASCRERVYSCV